jgi:tetratricopeptide (TPR) repeat protein
MAQWKDIVQLVANRSGFGGEVSDVSVEGSTNAEEPIRWRYHYLRKDYSDAADNRITSPMPFLALPKAETKAEEPTKLGSPGEYHYEAVVKLPAGSAPRVPPRRELHEEFADYTANYEVAGGALKVDRRLVVKAREIPSADLDAYKKFAEAVQDDQTTYIDLKGRRRLTFGNYQEAIWELPYSKNKEAAKAYDEAREDYEKKDSRAQIAALERAVRLDPTFTRAWLWLGDVYRSHGDEKASFAAYNSAIQNDPKETLGYKVLAYNQILKGRYEEAASTWKKLVAIAPDDADGQEGLGLVLVYLGREQEATGPLEAAYRLDPSRKEELLLQLGPAYLKAGHVQEGLDALNEGLGDKPSAWALNNAAWGLVEADQKLPLALDYAERAVRAIEEQSAKASLADLKMEDLSTVIQLAAYWDTLGWVHAKTGHLGRAQRYLEAAWALSQSATVGDHLAYAYEKQKKIEDAKHMRELASTAQRGGDVLRGRAGPAKATPSSPELTKADAAHREELTKLRSVELPTITTDTSSAEYLLLIGAGAKVVDARFVSGDDALKKAAAALKTASVGTSLPDDGPMKIVRRGVVSCSQVSGCSLVLFTPDQVRSIE